MNLRIKHKISKRLGCKKYLDYRNGFMVLNLLDGRGKKLKRKVRFRMSTLTVNRNGRIYAPGVVEKAFKQFAQEHPIKYFQETENNISNNFFSYEIIGGE